MPTNENTEINPHKPALSQRIFKKFVGFIM